MILSYGKGTDFYLNHNNHCYMKGHSYYGRKVETTAARSQHLL